MKGSPTNPWLLDVCVIGAQKAGSTSMAQWLADHPAVCHSRIKETHFWAGEPLGRDRPDERSVQTWFSDQFAESEAGQLLVDSSTSYSMFPEFSGVPQRLHAHNPNMRFIYVLRDPVTRIESHLAHSYRNGVIDAVGLAAVDADPTFIERSSYHMQLSQFLDVYPRDQIHVLLLEELIADPTEGLTSTAEFLGIEAGRTDLPRSNVSADRSGVTELEVMLSRRGIALPLRIRRPLRRRWGRNPARPLTTDERTDLRQRLAEDRSALEVVLGRPLPWNR